MIAIYRDCFTCLFPGAAISTNIWRIPCSDDAEVCRKPYSSFNARCINTNTEVKKNIFTGLCEVLGKTTVQNKIQ